MTTYECTKQAARARGVVIRGIYFRRKDSKGGARSMFSGLFLPRKNANWLRVIRAPETATS